MANVRIINDGCDGHESKRGHRGHRGDTGPTGPTGPTGFSATGPTGPAGPAGPAGTMGLQGPGASNIFSFDMLPNLTAGAPPVMLGTPVFNDFTSTDPLPIRAFSLPNATPTGLHQLVGLVTNIKSGGVLTVQYGGIVTLTTAQWDAVVTGIHLPGGLQPQSNYFLGAVDSNVHASGGLSLFPPGPTDFTVYIGVALTPTQLLLGTLFSNFSNVPIG